MNYAVEFQEVLAETLRTYRNRMESFDESYRSYTDQYGEQAVSINEPTLISDTIDPVIIILGRNTPLLYRDSNKTVEGRLTSALLSRDGFYVLGRREPLDSKLIMWGPHGETELTQYDSRVQVIPSRIHAAIWFRNENTVYFTDLGSSSGSIVAGESKRPEPFIVAYATPKVDIRRIQIPSKYARP